MSMIAAAWLALTLIQAPSRDEVGCVLEAAAEGDPRLLAETMAAGDFDRVTVERYAARAATCAPRFGWTRERIPLMTMAAVALQTRDGLAANLNGLGVRTAIIDGWFTGQGEAQRTEMDIDDARGDQIAAELTAAAIPAAAMEAHNADVGRYVGSLMMLERLRLGLPIN